MIKMDIKKLSKRLGIPMAKPDDPIYSTSPEIRFTSQSAKSTTNTQKDSASQNEKVETTDSNAKDSSGE